MFVALGSDRPAGNFIVFSPDVLLVTVAAEDVDLVVAAVREAGLKPAEDERKWDHMGALIVDAALQPRTRYTSTVLPRARRVRDQWPDARTTTGLRARLESVDLSAYLVWRRTSPKIPKIYDLTAVMGDLGVDTVDDLSARFRDPMLERTTREALRRVKHVGPKTVDYIAILAGSTDHVAVDQHIAAFVRAAECGPTPTNRSVGSPGPRPRC